MTQTVVNPLTERQQKFLRVIRVYIREYGYPPTFRDLMKVFNISSPNGIACHLKALERKGAIVIDRNVSRGIRLVADGTCPHCGQQMPVAAT